MTARSELQAVLSGVVPVGGLASIAAASRDLIAGSVVVANLIGAAVVMTLLSFVLPLPTSAGAIGRPG